MITHDLLAGLFGAGFQTVLDTVKARGFIQFPGARIETSTVLALEEGLFLPIRALNPECLVTLDGKSVISRLAENCDYIIIEDADLRPQDLIDHVKMFLLHSITIQDVTSALGLTGNHAYVVWYKTEAARPDFSGERIW